MTAHVIIHYAGCACYIGALPAAVYSLRQDLRRARPVIAAALRAMFPTAKQRVAPLPQPVAIDRRRVGNAGDL